MMAEQEVYLPEEDLGEPPPQPKKKRRALKIILLLLLLAVLVVGGFVLGIYLRIFDLNEINERIGLYDLPVIGEYFVRPAEKDSSEEQPPAQENGTAKPKESKVENDRPDANSKQSKPVVLTKKEIEKQMKEQQAAEKKRISKLARLYNDMKPAEAAKVLQELDENVAIAILQRMDESQASKVLGALDAETAARLTRNMYNGPAQRTQQSMGVSGEEGNQNGQASQRR